MASIWVAGVRVPVATVMDGLPTVLSLKKKLPSPPATPTEEIEPSKSPVLPVSKSMVGEVEVRFTVPTKLVTRLL